jgi:hypothetical protein
VSKEVVLPASNFESMLWKTLQSCIRIGFAESSSAKVLPAEINVKGKVLESVLSVYASISKPYYLDQYFLACDGTLLNTSIDGKSQRTRNLPYINEVALLESPYKASLDRKRENLETFLSSIEKLKSEGDIGESLLNSLYDTYLVRKSEYDNLLVQSLEKDLIAYQLGNHGYWKKVDNKLGKFRESFIRDKGLTRNYIEKSLKNVLWQQLKISTNTSEISSDHLYAYDTWAPIDLVVYGAIDYAGLIPIISDGADLVGLCYAGVRGDFTNVGFYSAGLVIPLAVGGGTLKAADNLYVAVAFKNEKGVVDFALTTSAKVADDLHLFSIVAKSRSEAEKIFAESIVHVDKAAVGKLLDNIAVLKAATRKLPTGWEKFAAFDNLVVKIQGLGNQADAFVKDFASASNEVIAAFGRNADLVDAWKVLHKPVVGDVVRKNVRKLDELNGLLKGNNLGWGKTDFENFLTRPLDKPWDNVDEVISALKRTSDANILGLTISYKKFPQPKDGSYSYVLDQAKNIKEIQSIMVINC